jgi:transcriptional regulator with XRE-family HTH domain
LHFRGCLVAFDLIFLVSHRDGTVSISKISIRQIKAARSLLGWSQDDLAAHSGVSKPTIGRLESDDAANAIGGRPETAEKLVAALEKAGVEFIPENGGGAGVRLARRAKRSR